MARVYALSDVHGEKNALKNALHEIFSDDFQPDDKIIFVEITWIMEPILLKY